MSAADKKAEQVINDASKKVDQTINQAENDAKDAAKQAENTAEKLAEDARSAANKVSDFVHKEAEEIEERAKEAGESCVLLLTSFSKCFSKTSKDLQEKWSKFSSSPRCWIPVLSAVNVAILGALGYVGYQNRSKVENADKRVLGAAAVGIASLLGGEGYLAVTSAKKQCRK